VGVADVVLLVQPLDVFVDGVGRDAADGLGGLGATPTSRSRRAGRDAAGGLSALGFWLSTDSRWLTADSLPVDS